jgi:hypothetical protein
VKDCSSCPHRAEMRRRDSMGYECTPCSSCRPWEPKNDRWNRISIDDIPEGLLADRFKDWKNGLGRDVRR